MIPARQATPYFAALVCAATLPPTFLVAATGLRGGGGLWMQWAMAGFVIGFLGGLGLAANGSRWWALLLVPAIADGCYPFFEALGRMH